MGYNILLNLAKSRGCDIGGLYIAVKTDRKLCNRVAKMISQISYRWYFQILWRREFDDIFKSCGVENLWDLTVKHIEGLVQDYSISIANALEILQSCTKPLIWSDTEMTSW